MESSIALVHRKLFPYLVIRWSPYLGLKISRTVSSIIRKKWRKIISTSKYITEQKCKEIAIEILNQTFMSPGHKEFVNGKLRKNMKRKFKFAFFDDENVEVSRYWHISIEY